MGRGVITKTKISSGEFVMEYKGDLISRKEGLQREKMYEEAPSYLFFFTFRGKQKWLVNRSGDPRNRVLKFYGKKSMAYFRNLGFISLIEFFSYFLRGNVS